MKRRVLMIAVMVLFVFPIVTLPASASTGTANTIADAKQPAQINQSIKLGLADVLNSLPEGFHDQSAGNQNQFSCLAEGWATDPDDRSTDLNVRVLSDGVEVAQVVAGAFRQDLADAGVCIDGTCSFSVNLWGLISADTDHIITEQARDAQTGEWVNLSDTPKTLNCSEINFLPEGFHDAAEGTQNQFSCIAEGWVTDPNDRGIDLHVRILSDGVEVAQTVADVFRQDLYDAGVCIDGTCSFSVGLWGLISTGIDHSISVQARDAQTDEWVNLGNTPKTLKCIGPGWRQLNANGFGDPQTVGANSLEIFRGRLYAGTTNANTGGQVWRLADNEQWQQVSEAGFGNGSANAAVIDLVVFKNQLYAGVGWGGAPGQVWRSANGRHWQPVTTDGFGDDVNTAFTNFVVFGGRLYAGTGSSSGSAQIWRSNTGGSNSWTQVAPDGAGLTGNVTGFAVYKGVLYAAIESDLGEPAQVWRSTNGSDWTTVTTDGFGDSNNISTGGFAKFGAYLYLGTRNDATGGQLWRTKDGLHWETIVSDGFGSISNVKVESLLVYNDLLYAVTFNGESGLQIWRSVDAVSWEPIITNGFGDSNNISTLWNNAILKYQGQILIGTWNYVDGGELWMSTP